MTSANFATQTQAMTAAASAFDGQADPIIEQSARLETIKGTSATSGRAYSAQGGDYHDAVTGKLEKLVRTYGEKCIWVATTLRDTQSSYEGADGSGSAAITTSGAGA